MNSEEHRQVILDWLGIYPDQACKRCGGRGRRLYGSTATWRGGIGGQAMTTDVCDVCWGTGRSDKTGANLKRVVPVAKLNDALKRIAELEAITPMSTCARCLVDIHCENCERRNAEEKA